MLLNSLKRCIASAKHKKWDKVYVAVDLHDTVLYGNYSTKEIPKEFCPGAKEALQMMTKRNDIKLIMYTCSWPDEIAKYVEYFKENEITFDFINENPDVPNNALGHYDKKLYFQLLFDDKAGFDCDTDWFTIVEFFNQPENKLQ